jgi:hypothetical protein
MTIPTDVSKYAPNIGGRVVGRGVVAKFRPKKTADGFAL